MSTVGPAKAWVLTLIATFMGALWLMLALPAFGLRPGYWSCWFILAAIGNAGDLVALSFRMRW